MIQSLQFSYQSSGRNDDTNNSTKIHEEWNGIWNALAMILIYSSFIIPNSLGIVRLPFYDIWAVAKTRDFTKPNIWEHIKSD